MIFFYEIPSAKKRNRLVLLDAGPTNKPAPLVTTGLESFPVLTNHIVIPDSNTLVIVLNRFIFFGEVSQQSMSSSK